MSDSLSILFYISMFALSALMVGYGHKNKSVFMQVVGLLIPIFIGGLRYNVGLDYNAYLNAYADVINPQIIDRYIGIQGIEQSFSIISSLSDLIFHSPIAMFSFYAAITVLAFYSSLKLMKPEKVGVALFFFYSIFLLNSFNIVRQGAAISVGGLALVHYINGNRLKALVYFLVASIIHISALLLLVYVIIEFALKKRLVINAKVKNLAKTVALTIAMSALIVVIGLKVPAAGDLIYTITGRVGEYKPGVSIGIAFKYLLALGCLVLAAICWASMNEVRKRLTIFVAIGLVIYSLGLVYNQAARFGIYLVALSPILFAVAYDTLRLISPKTSLLVSTGAVFLSMVYVISVHVGTEEGVQYNYQSVVSSSQYNKEIKELGI